MTGRSQLTALLILAGAFHAGAGTLSYVAVSPVQSDVNCGIDSSNQYTTAVDGGNASGNDRVINGVRLYSLVGSGQSASADNCTLNALTGTLSNSQLSGTAPQADGILAAVLSDTNSNDGASDNSQQEIVLDPASLTAGTTYDLRIYIANSGMQDREVNLAFVGDGQAPVETGFFNEEDARTSPGAFRDPNQVYYIEYRFTWDGASTPGVTITQKSGQAPFALYALTNQPVIEQTAAAPAAPVAPIPAAATTALVSAVPDQVGVTSDTFYSNESLKKHGRWIEVKKYGRCWQPTDSPPDWRPYSRGHFAYSDDGGYVWISDSSENEWGWACYHYGRWCRVPGVGSGWAWVPGTAWNGAWVSWRQGRDREHGFVGWAPLPPEATLRVGVGISTWADREYDIGPDYYTFISVRDFGSDSYWRPGLIVDRRRYVDIISHTVNITNINYTNFNGNVSSVSITQVRAYNGGPDFTFINTQIRQQGGREISRIQVDRVGTENFNGAAGSRLQGNTFVVFTPPVTSQSNPRVLPKVVATVPDNKIDHGWAELKDQKLQTQLRNQIAEQTKGQTPATTKAVLPPQVIQAAAQSAATTASPSQSPQAPGVTTIPAASPSAGAANQIAGAVSPTPPVATSPVQSPSGGVANTSPSPAASQPPAANKTLHPGEKLTSPAVATGRATPPPTGSATPASGAAVTSALSAETQQSATPKVLHPGAKVESKPVQSPAVATNAASPSSTAGAAQSPAGRGQHPGEKIVSAPGQSPAPIRVASPTPTKPTAVTTTQASPSPAVGLHPGAKIVPTPAQSLAPAVAGTSASPVVPTQQSPARNVQAQRNQLATPPPAQTPRGAVTVASPSPTPQVTPPVVGRQNQPRGRAETNAPVTPTPGRAQVASTPPQPPVTARTPAPARAVETAQTPPPVQTPAVTKKVTAPAVTREPASPSPAGPSQQQLQAIEEQKRQQQIEERMRQQQQQKQQEQAEQKLQQQQTQQRQQQQLEQEQKQAQQKTEQAQAKQQEAAQQKERQLQQQKQQQLQQQQAEQKQLQVQKQQEAAQQKERQLQQQKQQEAQQRQAEQKKALQQQALQKQQEAAQQKERQAQQLKEQQAQQRQQELKQQQAQQKAEQQQQLKQQQQQQQAEQRQQQLRQQQLQEQAQRQRQQQQSQQQNRRAATPTPSPGG